MLIRLSVSSGAGAPRGGAGGDDQTAPVSVHHPETWDGHVQPECEWCFNTHTHTWYDDIRPDKEVLIPFLLFLVLILLFWFSVSYWMKQPCLESDMFPVHRLLMSLGLQDTTEVTPLQGAPHWIICCHLSSEVFFSSFVTAPSVTTFVWYFLSLCPFPGLK